MEFFLRCSRIALHALHNRLDFAPTLSCEFFASAAKLIDRFTPSFHLGGGLELKGRLLLLDFLVEAVDILLNLRVGDLFGGGFACTAAACRTDAPPQPSRRAHPRELGQCQNEGTTRI